MMFEAVRNPYFPCSLTDGIIAKSAHDSNAFWWEASALMDMIFPSYTDLGAYGYAVPSERREKSKPLAQVFQNTHHEYFLFRDEAASKAIGFSYGHMRDPQTFFMASSGVLPGYQRRGIYSAFLLQLLRYLHTLGYERILSNHHTNNRAIIIAKLKAGFNMSAGGHRSS